MGDKAGPKPEAPAVHSEAVVESPVELVLSKRLRAVRKKLKQLAETEKTEEQARPWRGSLRLSETLTAPRNRRSRARRLCWRVSVSWCA